MWVAAESQVARAIRRYLTSERGIERHWMKAAGYWQRGATGVRDNIADNGGKIVAASDDCTVSPVHAAS